MKVVITDYWYENLDEEKKIFAAVKGLQLEAHHCKDEEQLCRLVRDADAVIVQFAPMTQRVIDSMGKCRIIVRYAIGVDNIDLDAATAKGIYVANVPDYSIDEVSNHAITLLMALSKKLIPLAASVKAGLWDYTISKPLYRMRDKTLGLIGFGRIPCMVAEKMRGFGVNIQCYDPYIRKDLADKYGVMPVSLQTLLETSDYISVHCPLTKETYHMLNRDAFARMKNTALLINTARGPIVEEAALLEALQNQRIAGAALDVVEHEPIQKDSALLTLDNVIVTPHNAWYSEDAIATLQRSVAEEVVRVLTGHRPKNLVNKAVLEMG